MEELIDANLQLRHWNASGQSRTTSICVRDDSLGNCTSAVVDARSLFDHLSKESSGVTNDKRTAREMQIIRQSLDDTSGKVHWVPGNHMIADCLTKANGQRELVLGLIASACLALTQSK